MIKIAHHTALKNIQYVFLPVYVVSGVRFQVSAYRFQGSGFRCRQTYCPEGTIQYLRHTLPFPQRTASGVLDPGLSAPMFFPIHSTYERILFNDPKFLNSARTKTRIFRKDQGRQKF